MVTSGTTDSFGEGKTLSADLRATSPEDIARVMADLKRMKETARDYIVPSGRLHARAEDGSGDIKAAFMLREGPLAGTSMDFTIAKIAHEQFGDKLGIPGNYYRKMLDVAPGLLVNNLNYWLQFNPQNIMLRTVDGRIRAALSDRYRALDDYDLLFHAVDVGRGMGAVVQRLDLSEERFFFRMVLPDFAAKITGRGEQLGERGKFFSSGYRMDNGQWGMMDDDDPNGDWVFPAIIGSNSEVGRGKLIVDLSMMRVTCRNYITVSKTIHRVHLGERIEGGFELSADTREAKDKSIWLEVRDLIKAAFNEDTFKAMVKQANDAQAAVLVDPIEAVDVVVATYGIDEADRDELLKELISPRWEVNPGITLWGLSQALTTLAHEKNLNEGYALEQAGGDLLTRGKELVKVR